MLPRPAHSMAGRLIIGIAGNMRKKILALRPLGWDLSAMRRSDWAAARPKKKAKPLRSHPHKQSLRLHCESDCRIFILLWDGSPCMLIAIVLENERVGVPLDTEFDHSLTVKSVEEYETVLLAGRNKFMPKKKTPEKVFATTNSTNYPYWIHFGTDTAENTIQRYQVF